MIQSNNVYNNSTVLVKMNSRGEVIGIGNCNVDFLQCTEDGYELCIDEKKIKW